MVLYAWRDWPTGGTGSWIAWLTGQQTGRVSTVAGWLAGCGAQTQCVQALKLTPERLLRLRYRSSNPCSHGTARPDDASFYLAYTRLTGDNTHTATASRRVARRCRRRRRTGTYVQSDTERL